MITDHKLISSSDFRKHHDSPFLWIFVSIGSLSLHLLVFWLLQSSTNFSSSLSDSKQDIISVDFVDVSTLPTSQKSGKSPIVKNTNQSSKNSIEKPVEKPIEKQSDAATNVAKQDLQPDLDNNSTINSNITNIPSSSKNQSSKSKITTTKPENNQSQNSKSLINKNPNPQTTKPENNQSENSKSPINKNPNPQTTKPENNQSQKKTLPVKQQPYPAFTNKPQPKTTIPEQEKPWNRHQDIKLGEEKPLPQDIKPEPVTTDQRENKGGAIANVTPLIKDEVNELIRQKLLIVDALPDILPEYKGSKTKDIDISLLPNDVILQPANIFASLIIDNNGNFKQAVIISIEPDTLRSEKRIYEKALNQIFQESSFTAAVNKDGSKPELSNLYVRLRIDLTNY